MADDKNIAVSVKNLTKVYPLYKAPKYRLKETLHPFRKKYHKEFYALKDVSFEIYKGDSLGIIGQNGSGKSTLLKILTGVLTPTSGCYHINGLVISLLELGSGFNPELTGMENIFFYGTILGFSKKQLGEKLDGILSFADIGQFIYQPLKTYSTGMRARLAFSVASNVDPEILILDEVLSVGDIRFQQKCFRVMQNLIDQGKTIILVSHSTGAVTNFCNKSMWLDEGHIKDFGQSKDVVKEYVSYMTYGMESKAKEKSTNSTKKQFTKEETGDNNDQKLQPVKKDEIQWTDVSNCDSFGKRGATIDGVAVYFRDSKKRVEVLKGGEWISIFVQLQVKKTLFAPGLGIMLKDRYGGVIFSTNNYQHNIIIRELTAGEHIVLQTDIKVPNLKNGQYTLSIAIADGTQDAHVQHHWVHAAMVFHFDNKNTRLNKGSGLIIISHNEYFSKTV